MFLSFHFISLISRYVNCLIFWILRACLRAYLWRCTGTYTPAWHCTDVYWSDRGDPLFRGKRTHCHENLTSEAEVPPLPPAALTRSPSAACQGSLYHLSPATRLAPWCGNRRRNKQINTERLTFSSVARTLAPSSQNEHKKTGITKVRKDSKVCFLIAPDKQQHGTQTSSQHIQT